MPTNNAPPNCPKCGKPLTKIRYPSDSMLNRDQWESQLPGDLFCECHNNHRGNKPYAYFWESEFSSGVAAVSPASASATKLTTHQCDCGRKLLVEGQVIGKESVAAAPASVDQRIQKFWDAQAEWSQATFGTDAERDHIGPLKHLAKEAVEAQVRPSDPVEIADCLFLTFDAARRSGMTLDTLMKVADQKLLVNKARKWSKPTDDNPVEHVRELDSQTEKEK